MTKRNSKFLISITGVAGLIIICVIFKIKYDKYLWGCSELERKYSWPSGYEWFYAKSDTVDYAKSDGQIIAEMKLYSPKSTDSIYCLNDIKKLDWRIDNNAYWYDYYRHTIDMFSDEMNVVVYFPLYDKRTKRKESFILLSTGIDGKQNNFLSEKDTLFIDDWQTKLKLYNPNHPYAGACDSISFFDKDGMVKFNLFNLFFGCKDQLLQVGRVDFASQNWRTRSEEEMALISKKIDKILEERKKLD